jgi:hypothetical protein
MVKRLTVPGLICAAVLCLFAIGTARAADSAATDRKNEYKVAIAQADADYKAAKDACQSRQGNDRDVCMQQAKADHVKATEGAKARLKANTAMADAHEDTMDAQYKVAKEKCEPLSGDAKDACINQAKLKYHQ